MSARSDHSTAKRPHVASALTTSALTTVALLAGGFAPAAGQDAAYDFSAPAARFELPGDLDEISGLTVLDAAHVAAVQDEEGELYVLSLATGEVTRRTPFGKTGDYEGVELLGDRLFVMTSDATVTELLDWRTGDIATRVYDLGLGAKRCNAEGLGADGERLLLACKNADDTERNRVYAVELAAAGEPHAEVLVKLHAEDVPRGEKFLRPSAIAVHPVTGETVVLSSRRETLVRLDACGRVVGTWDFDAADLEQPEGLAFLPNGDVLIASEGDEDAAVLVRYAYRG